MDLDKVIKINDIWIQALEEIAQENAEIFKHNGGEQFSAIPCLNDSDPGMDVIRQLVLRELQGWI